MLAGAGLGNDPALPHAPRQQRLADGVVDLVRAGVGEVLAFQVDARAAGVRREARREIHGRGAPHVVAQQRAKFGEERRVRQGGFARGVEIQQRGHERLADVPPAERAEVAGSVGQAADKRGAVHV